MLLFLSLSWILSGEEDVLINVNISSIIFGRYFWNFSPRIQLCNKCDAVESYSLSSICLFILQMDSKIRIVETV